jgi:predicted acyltransferase
MLLAPDLTTIKSRANFTFGFAAGCAIAACLLNPLYGISKNNATPSWCLWACAITAALWFLFYLVCDVRPVKIISCPLALAGQNVLLAYLLSEMLPGLLEVLHLGDGYGCLGEINLAFAIARSALCGILILLAVTGLNRLDFRLKL